MTAMDMQPLTESISSFINIGGRLLDVVTTTTTCADPPLIVDGPNDPSTEQTFRLVELSGTLDFWEHPDEDVYSLDDGSPA